MNTVIVGCGAIGSVAALGFHRAGWPLTLADADAEHVTAIRAGGLRVIEPGGEQVVYTKACLPRELSGEFDLIVIAVKSQHTGEAWAGVARALSPDGLVLCLQNGLNPLLIAEQVGSERTLAAFVNIQSIYEAPGRVRTGRRGSFYVGGLTGETTPRLQGVVAALAAVRPTVATDNVLGYLWSKMSYASMLVSSALVDAPVYEYIDRYPGLIRHAVGEVAAAALSDGVVLERFDFFDPYGMLDGTYDFAEMRADWAARDIPYTGIWRDIVVRKRPTEVAAQLGQVVALGEQSGRPMPVNQRIVQMVGEIEGGERQQGWHNLDELELLAEGDDRSGKGACT